MNRIPRSMAGAALLLALLSLPVLAQRGEINGRVVTEEGVGLPDVPVALWPAASSLPWVSNANILRASTDEEGRFKFANVAPRAYLLMVFSYKGRVRPFATEAERRIRDLVRVGDNVTVTLVRGGVITGRVTTANGDPMIGVWITPRLVRDPDGQPVSRDTNARMRLTDDRGVYRIYGLAPGSYTLSVRNATSGATPSPYEGDVVTWYPSATRDTAAEVAVADGGEVTGIDIRFRGEHGRAVSGRIASGGEAGATIALRSAASGYELDLLFVRQGGPMSFAFHGVPDGEYELIARNEGDEKTEAMAAPVRRVTVRGADVAGIELRLAPLASVAGKVLLEATPAKCDSPRAARIEETALSLRRDPASPGGSTQLMEILPAAEPNEKGEFTIRGLDPGKYTLQLQPPDGTWRVKSIAGPGPVDLARTGVSLAAGQRLAGVAITLVADGASLRGRVANASARLRVHLLPAEETAADEALRYAETTTDDDGGFAFASLAPGRYRLLARPIDVDADRARLRKEAAAKEMNVELKPCQRMTGVTLAR